MERDSTRDSRNVREAIVTPPSAVARFVRRNSVLRWRTRPSPELRDRRWKPNTHEKPRECLQEWLQEGRLEPPPRAETRGVVCQVVKMQAVYLSKIDDKGLLIALVSGRTADLAQNGSMVIPCCPRPGCTEAADRGRSADTGW
jgi:hypothetical protein